MRTRLGKEGKVWVEAWGWALILAELKRMRTSRWAPLPRPAVHRQGHLEGEAGEESNPEHGVRKECHSHSRETAHGSGEEDQAAPVGVFQTQISCPM